jgi:hypothetical protein
MKEAGTTTRWAEHLMHPVCRISKPVQRDALYNKKSALGSNPPGANDPIIHSVLGYHLRVYSAEWIVVETAQLITQPLPLPHNNKDRLQ